MKDNEEKSLAYKAGYALGTLVCVCLSVCLAAVVIAATAKFLSWLIFI